MSAVAAALDETGPISTEALAHIRTVVARSGTSFSLGMRLLTKPRRHAMFAVYTFGREVDDVADGDEAPDVKLRQLDAWREEVEALFAGRPRRLTTQALLGPINRYALPKEEFVGLIDGMAMDARDEMRAVDNDRLMLYCRRAAGTIGLLSVRVFGGVGALADQFALDLADGFQLTNILRDLEEDAARDRLYLPREAIVAVGLDPDRPPRQVIRQPAIAEVCAGMARTARKKFLAADQALARLDRRVLRPALLMMGIYERYLDRLEQRGWAPAQPPLKLSKREKLWAAFRQGLFRPQWQPST